MCSSRLAAVKTLAQSDFAFQPIIKREQIETLHEFGLTDSTSTNPVICASERTSSDQKDPAFRPGSTP